MLGEVVVRGIWEREEGGGRSSTFWDFFFFLLVRTGFLWKRESMSAGVLHGYLDLVTRREKKQRANGLLSAGKIFERGKSCKTTCIKTTGQDAKFTPHDSERKSVLPVFGIFRFWM